MTKLIAALALASFPLTVRANVYATDIKVNGSLSAVSVTPTPSSPVTVTYILNQAASLGCTVNILSGSAPVAAIAGGTNLGLNTVAWGGTNQAGAAVGPGAYSISITASASDVSGGSNDWTQISIDGSNTVAVLPLGIDVDKNTNSPYYGRVVVGCASSGGEAHGIAQQAGLYKANADGSPADEGAFGNAGYTTNDDGLISTNQMPATGQPSHGPAVPGLIRIGEDDRIYFIDQSGIGAVVACDMRATTNQLVICEGPGSGTTGLQASVGFPASPHNYANNPEGGLLNNIGVGWAQFDVAGFKSGQPALYLCDTGDDPCPGVWMYRLTNGAADAHDTVGAQLVAPNSNPGTFVPSDIAVTSGGLTVDDHLDIFVADSQFDSRANESSDPAVICDRLFCFSNWNGGVLPPEGAGENTYAFSNGSSSKWGIGTLDDQLTGINDTVIDSRSNPTLVAVAMFFGASESDGYVNGGVALLDAGTGAFVETNLDSVNFYTSAAFDNAGNVYACSTTAYYWRVWSPPGANTNTTVAVAGIVVPGSAPTITITGITSTPTGGGCASVTINFSATGGPSASTFVVKGSSALKGAYATVAGATITGGSGTYQATFSNCLTQFYVIAQPAQ
jgi:hypothetical protein